MRTVIGAGCSRAVASAGAWAASLAGSAASVAASRSKWAPSCSVVACGILKMLKVGRPAASSSGVAALQSVPPALIAAVPRLWLALDVLTIAIDRGDGHDPG